MLLMLVDTPDSRHWGRPDPEPDADGERERRWEPISRRLFLPAAGSMSCFLVTPFAGGAFANWALTLGGVAFCAQFVRVSLRDDPPSRARPRPAGDHSE